MRYLACLVLCACSGAVSDPSTKPPIQSLTVTPNPATLYPGLPATFIITGGVPPYIAVSSNQTLIPIAGTVGSTFTLSAGGVGSDTPVTLTVRDTLVGINVPITVKPEVVSSQVTILPTDTVCKPGICSGEDALVTATLTVADGTPRTLRFEPITGDFQVVGNSTVTTDAAGNAQVRIRVSPAAPTQSALLQITDTASGSFQRIGFQIIQKTNGAAFNTVPDTLTFTGPTTTACGTGDADVYIFGGVPPYTIGTLSGFSISPHTVSSSGGSFQVTALGFCNSGPLAITDNSGRTGTITLASQVGTTDLPVNVFPSAITLAACETIASANVTGGNGSYTVSVSGSGLIAALSGNALSIQRAAGGTPGTYTVSVASGNSTASIIVTVPSTAPMC